MCFPLLRSIWLSSRNNEDWITLFKSFVKAMPFLFSPSVLLYCMYLWITLFKSFVKAMLVLFSPSVYCTVCMLYEDWITLFESFVKAMLLLFSPSVYRALCIFGLHYFIVYLCYAWSSFSFCFILLNVYIANFNKNN